MVSKLRAVAYTPTCEAQANGLSGNASYIEAWRSMLARGQIGKRILKFPFVPWNLQPAGIYQQFVSVEGLIPHRVRYFDFGPGVAAFIISMEPAEGNWDLPRFQNEVRELLPYAEAIFKLLTRTRA
jgi:hypothetical protein